MSLALDTRIIELHRQNVAKLTPATARKLSIAVAGMSTKTNPEDVTVEDLLNYFPTRYEDRSNFLSIDRLEEGMEAAVELYVRTAGGMQVGKFRDGRKPPLYIFEITAGDVDRRLKPVSV